MTIRLIKDDLTLMTTIADYRVLTKGQAVRLLSRNEHALRARLNQLRAAGYLETMPTITSKQGRHEIQAVLTEDGFYLLKKQGLFPEKVSASAVLADQLAYSSHHRALNDFRVCLATLSKDLSALAVDFVTNTSPLFRNTPAGQVFSEDWLDNRQEVDDQHRLIPDGVFTIQHKSRNKALLFFLEIDRATEPQMSNARPQADIRHKIEGYQSCFQSKQYKRYGQAWKCKFNGFRVLFVTKPSHCVALCRTVRATRESDFIWVTDQTRLADHGLAVPIWFRGGRFDLPETSILGPEVSQQILEQAVHSGSAAEH